MSKRLSELLADLSTRAKSAEDTLDAAEKEAHDKIAARCDLYASGNPVRMTPIAAAKRSCQSRRRSARAIACLSSGRPSRRWHHSLHSALVGRV
jgi:hypothetical protein